MLETVLVVIIVGTAGALVALSLYRKASAKSGTFSCRSGCAVSDKCEVNPHPWKSE